MKAKLACDNESKYARYMRLRSTLLSERSTFEPSWRDCGEYILPTRPRWQVSDANRGERKNQSIIDSTGTFSARTLQSGMTSGITSPARPWFRLTTSDPNTAELSSTKYWLHDITERMRAMFLRTNTYNVLQMLYGDLGTFGISPMLVEEDFEQVLRCYSFPIGSYAIATDHRGKVDTFFHEYRMTVRQLVKKFGKASETGEIDWSCFSDRVKNMWENCQYNEWIDVCHIIEPNEEYDQAKLHSKYKAFSSTYFERGAIGTSTQSYQVNEDRCLRESGYDYFPVLCPRWGLTGEDSYATSYPGVDAIGDIKQLQLGEKRGMQAIEKMVNPPMIGPPELQNRGASVLPGGFTWTTERDGQKGFRPAYEVTPRIQELELKQDACRRRIRQAYFADLFLMASSSDRREITAREIDERHEEKLLALGPVLEQLNQDLLDPLIDIAFALMDRQGLVPPPPKEIAGQKLKVEYISVMAQAQKLAGISGMERFSAFITSLVRETGDNSILDKVNNDQLVNDYGDGVGISPKVIRSDDETQAIRQAKAKAQAAQHAAEVAKNAAGAAQSLGNTPTDSKNALTDLLRSSSGGGESLGVQ